MDDLIAALTETGATIAFDAIGGGKLAGQILTGMEVAANQKRRRPYSRYGSTTLQAGLHLRRPRHRPDRAHPHLRHGLGPGRLAAHAVPEKIGPAEASRLRQRVADELKTTFASHYTAEISLAEALQPEMIAAYNKSATGEKYLINPNKGSSDKGRGACLGGGAGDQSRAAA